MLHMPPGQACGNSVLFRMTTRACDGGGKPTTKRIEQLADQWPFLVKSLKIKVPQ